MDELRSPVCFLRMLWRSLKARHWVSGHNFVEVHDDIVPDAVQVLRCEDCGEHSVSWTAK